MFSFFKKSKNNKNSQQENLPPIVLAQNEFVHKLLSGIDFKWDNLSIHFEYYPYDDTDYYEIYHATYYEHNTKNQFDPSLDAIDALILIQREMSKNGIEPWTWVVFTLDSKGKYNFDFKYGIPPYVNERYKIATQ